jgi:glucose-6-phosphate dehydrogenase assembly protein OpcA
MTDFSIRLFVNTPQESAGVTIHFENSNHACDPLFARWLDDRLAGRVYYVYDVNDIIFRGNYDLREGTSTEMMRYYVQIGKFFIIIYHYF